MFYFSELSILFDCQVHIDELDSITSLMTVLRVRLKSNQNKAEVTRDPREKVNRRGFTNE